MRETLIPGIGVAFFRRAATAAVLHKTFDRNGDHKLHPHWRHGDEEQARSHAGSHEGRCLARLLQSVPGPDTALALREHLAPDASWWVWRPFNEPVGSRR
ncbi:MAG TPA: hypothetical protein VK439_07435 [Rubrivivax sp.]|nr:hypothetical protein [Rubrivivax sp.]